MQKDKLAIMRELVDKLNQASDTYYNGKTEIMSDHEWDSIFDKLKRIEEETGITLPDSPTINVSADNIVGEKEEHEFPALSLAKTKSVADLAKWAEGKPIWLSWKLDGLTLVVTYDNGKLSKVVTRGDGHIGTNITHLAAAIEGILPRIKNTGHIVIRGEAIISYSDFNVFNMEMGEEYANPRNLASGSLTLKNINEVKSRHIHWIPFTLVHTDEDIVSWGNRMDFLEKLGFKTVEHQLISHPTQENIGNVVQEWTEKLNSFDYPVDGLVISFDDTIYAASGNVTGHHATRAGYAFKWKDESATTELEYIEWSCAASTISPVAVFKPVSLEGTTVKRASLCNISECERLRIGGQGTKIEVIKSNKIIPKVINVIETIGTFTIPNSCPVCKADTEIIESENSSTRTLHCTNLNCPAKQLKKFVRFVSKDGVNIDGLSEQTVQKFINLGWVKEYADLFHLDKYAEELSTMDGFGNKSVSNLLKSIEKARSVEPKKFLYSLFIPLVGIDVCTRLLSAYSLTELINIAQSTTNFAVFATISGIGPEKSTSFVKWMQNKKNKEIVEHLLTELKIKEVAPTQKGTLCNELTFVITGDVHHYKNRNELKAYIESQGGKVTGSVSKSTNYLINNDINSTSSKNQKARQLGIDIISEDDFISKFTNK